MNYVDKSYVPGETDHNCKPFVGWNENADVWNYGAPNLSALPCRSIIVILSLLLPGYCAVMFEIIWSIFGMIFSQT